MNVEYPRAEFKNDPVIGKLYDMIAEAHKISQATKDHLLENRAINDFAERSRTFWVMDPKEKKPLYLHYDVLTWLHQPKDKPARFLVRIDSLTVYADKFSFEIHAKAKLDRN